MNYLFVSATRKTVHLSSDEHEIGKPPFISYEALCGRAHTGRNYAPKVDTKEMRSLFIQGGRKICKACNKIRKDAPR